MQNDSFINNDITFKVQILKETYDDFQVSYNFIVAVTVLC